LGVWEGQAEKFQQAYLRCEISYDDFCLLDAAVWKGMKVSTVKTILREIPLQPGFRELISYLRGKGLVSGSFLPAFLFSRNASGKSSG